MADYCTHAGSAFINCVNCANDAHVHEIAHASHWTMTAQVMNVVFAASAMCPLIPSKLTGCGRAITLGDVSV